MTNDGSGVSAQSPSVYNNLSCVIKMMKSTRRVLSLAGKDLIMCFTLMTDRGSGGGGGRLIAFSNVDIRFSFWKGNVSIVLRPLRSDNMFLVF